MTKQGFFNSLVGRKAIHTGFNIIYAYQVPVLRSARQVSIPATYSAISNLFHFGTSLTTTVKGKSEPITVFPVITQSF